jgi:prefoldin alpha subunit
MANSATLLQKKVREYEVFVNDRLRVDLKRAWNERDRLFSEIAEYERLRVTLTTLDESYEQQRKNNNIDEPLATQIDLGCSFFVQAECPLNNLIFISVGFGLYCELSYAEAKSFIEKKVSHLRQQEVELTKKIAHIKANIKMVLQALKEIQGIDEKPSEPMSMSPL